MAAAFLPDAGASRRSHVLLVSGTRPEIIKLAPLYHALRESDWAQPFWLHTGQHGDMAEQMLGCFDIRPDRTLTRAGESLQEFSVECRLQLDRLMAERPWSTVVVQGDTESAFLGALAGFYRQIPVAHVEAGLRTYNLSRPFPEEGLRQMISRITRFHFAPTARAREALLAEGVAAGSIWTTGNTVIDAQHWACRHRGIRRRAQGHGHMLVTMHRRENWGHDLEEVCQAIAHLARSMRDIQVLFPVHLNPVVQGPVHGILRQLPNVQLTAPFDYLTMQQALADAWIVLTDSGGLQEEAPTFGVPLLVLREETERPEAAEAGCAMVVGTGGKVIVNAVHALRYDRALFERMSRAGNPFGDGTASAQIVRQLAAELGVGMSAVRPPEQRHVVA